jgi:hypothetical protein
MLVAKIDNRLLRVLQTKYLQFLHHLFHLHVNRQQRFNDLNYWNLGRSLFPRLLLCKVICNLLIQANAFCFCERSNLTVNVFRWLLWLLRFSNLFEGGRNWLSLPRLQIVIVVEAASAGFDFLLNLILYHALPFAFNIFP